MTRRQAWIASGIATLLIGGTVAGSWGYSALNYRRAIARAVADQEQGRLAEARSTLETLAREFPDDPQVHYRLGLCAYGLGDRAAAFAHLNAVPGTCDLAPEAATPLAELALERGAYSVAENALLEALEGQEVVPTLASKLRISLAFVLQRQLRFDEIRPLLRQAFEHAPDPALVAQLHALGDAAFDTTEMHEALDRALAASPDDDRVWLGLARRAIRNGDSRTAETWLERCEARRPGDPAIARTRLVAAYSRGDVDGVVRAAARLPEDGLDSLEALKLRAWLVGRRGAPDLARGAYEELLDRSPCDAITLERLAALEIRAGHLDRAATLRDRKGDLDKRLDRYLNQLRSTDLRAVAESLARDAEALDRPFEAMAWWSILARARPDHPEAASERDRLAAIGREPPPSPSFRELRSRWEADLASAEGARRGRGEIGAPPEFEDVAAQAGADFRFDNGRTPARQLPETMSGGVALLDYDGDGWLDIYAVQGGPLSRRAATPPGPGDRLYRNRGDGTFADVTGAVGLPLASEGYGIGVAVGDIDNDGFPDLLVTRLTSCALYRNRGDGTFVDATHAWGLDGPRDWPTSAAFADIDRDGDLDLYVCHYLEWDVAHPRPCREPGTHEYTYCDVRPLEPTHDRLFRNDNGRFVDITEEAGIVDVDGRGLAVLAADLDDDGNIDFYVANDTTANFLFRNRGDGTFEEVGHAAGVAGSASGGYQAGMGIAGGDLDGDGRIDLAVTNFYGESTTFYQNLGGGLYSDRSDAVGLRAASRTLLGFGAWFFDFNNDGHLDLLTANGHVQEIRDGLPRPMPLQLLAGDGRGRLVDVSRDAGPPLSSLRVARGLAVGDLDRDGRLDAVVLGHEGPLAVLANRSDAGRWVQLRLVGTESNRDAVGASVTLTAGGRHQTQQRLGGGSYQSASGPWLHFGLGDAEGVDLVEVRWPSGRVESIRDLAADAIHTIIEGRGLIANP